MQRSSSLQRSNDWQNFEGNYVRQEKDDPKRLEETTSRAHIGLGRVPVPHFDWTAIYIHTHTKKKYLTIC